jgi:hypothetical protein
MMEMWKHLLQKLTLISTGSIIDDKYPHARVAMQRLYNNSSFAGIAFYFTSVDRPSLCSQFVVTSFWRLVCVFWWPPPGSPMLGFIAWLGAPSSSSVPRLAPARPASCFLGYPR